MQAELDTDKVGVSRKDRPHSASGVYPQRWGHFAKGATKTQRWGQIAKVGYNRKGKGGAKMQMRDKNFYSYSILMKVARSRGYETVDSVVRHLAPILGKTRRNTLDKLMNGMLSRSECHVIGAFFQMTPVEYTDVFLNGLFVEITDGKYVCHIDDFEEHLKPLPEVKRRVGKNLSMDELMGLLDSL